MTGNVRHYFVDEHGDGTLFDAKGRVIVGKDGCSTHFALGLLDVPDPSGLTTALDELRRNILADPYFRGIESLKPERRKTAFAFHAKDDVAEVRMLVFQLLARHEVKFHAVIRSKDALVTEVRRRNARSSTYRYTQNSLYDEMVKRLFKNRLHKDDGYRICFASRGRADRTAALKIALEAARANFRAKWGIEADAPIEVSCSPSAAFGPLQAVDYFLWALQRAYTRREDRFLQLLWPRVSLVVDVDDRRKSPAGRYYSGENALTADEIQKKEPGI